jgi:hypothetical protein
VQVMRGFTAQELARGAKPPLDPPCQGRRKARLALSRPGPAALDPWLGGTMSASGSERRQRARIVGFRATDAEHAAVRAAAERAGLTVGAYVRKHTLGAPVERQSRRPNIDRAQVAQLLGQVGRIGGNINQIAHSLNAGGSPSAMLISSAVEDVAAMRRALMEALGRGHQGSE